MRCQWTGVGHDRCAIVNDDYPNFVGLHVIALVCIVLSVVGSLFVLMKAVRDGNYKTFSDRLPLYRCLADLMFAFVHTIDHSVLLGKQTYPSENIGRLLSSLVMIFVSYQMLVTTVLSIQSLVRVVFDYAFPLGEFEYRLHILAFCPPLVIFGIANGADAMGPFYYFQGMNPNTRAGMIYSWFCVAFFATILGTVICTSSWTIRKVDSVAKELKADPKKKDGRSASVARAVHRLHSFMIAACLQWIPCAVLIGATISFEDTKSKGLRLLFQYFGIIGANLGGVFNSIAYIYNERKFKRAAHRAKGSVGSDGKDSYTGSSTKGDSVRRSAAQLLSGRSNQSSAVAAASAGKLPMAGTSQSAASAGRLPMIGSTQPNGPLADALRRRSREDLKAKTPVLNGQGSIGSFTGRPSVNKV
ncbi:hypothetical protein DFJ77DRAFT_163858 [Powellomyces hirtus]|nr:hypothetical protein DFJ77DRAFT_163858 [Powellomyces hirtus]